MAEPPGLRQRKKERTAETIAKAATRLMLERGFDAVSIAEVAAAADVSKMTVSNYFPAKEDLILGRIADHADEAARAVREREPGETPLAALRRRFLDALAAADPFTGLSDDEAALAFGRLVRETPRLELAFTRRQLGATEGLARAFAKAVGIDPDRDPTPALAAAATIATERTLAARNLERILAGGKAGRLRRRALAEAGTAFDLLERGLAHTPLAG